MQKLILPINKMLITASYRSPDYKERFKLNHFGDDAISAQGSRTVYASGDGEVMLTGKDSVVGNLVAVRYNDVFNHKTGESLDVIIRYFHLSEIKVQKGGHVTKDTVIGFYGNTGKLSTGPHLHFEIDSNVEVFNSTSTLRGNSSLLCPAQSDSSLDPAELLYVKESAPDLQSVKADGPYEGKRYALPESAQLPRL